MSDQPGGVDMEELRMLARRQKDTDARRERRARQAEEQARAALAPNPEGYVVPPMPAGLSAIRRWVRGVHDVELTEVRRSAAAVGDLYRTGAELRKAEAAIRAAQAQERMADALATIEHGGTALVMLARLQESLTEGRRRPLPGRVHALPPPPEPAA
jgi:hypothetical protein